MESVIEVASGLALLNRLALEKGVNAIGGCIMTSTDPCMNRSSGLCCEIVGRRFVSLALLIRLWYSGVVKSGDCKRAR